MEQSWVESDKVFLDPDQDIWQVDYSSFPLLDPYCLDNPSRKLRFIQLTWERIRNDDQAYRREMARLLQPLLSEPDGDPGRDREHARRIKEYLREADIYIASTIRLLPKPARAILRPVRAVAECTDLRELLRLFLKESSPRQRFEAQRKLLLFQLLLDIDHSRHIQNGERHKAYFEKLLQQTLWLHTRQVHEMEIGFRKNQDGESIHYTSRPGPQDQRWRFQSIFLEKPEQGRTISLDVLYYNCRFKRTVQPVSFEIVDGRHRVLERLRWGEMRSHSSGSIISKMIRKDINNPDEISDLIGAMFIVHDEDALSDLLTLLDGCIGNPFRWRNVTDTLTSEQDRATLNPHSGKGYKVFKGDVDILIPGASPDQPPYLFPVEIQIYTLEAYLRTVCGCHEANHAALKLRQFLFGLVPRLFPKVIYGTDWLKLS